MIAASHETCCIGVGGNLGNVPKAICDVVRELNELPGISDVRLSRLYRSEPMGVDAGNAYINAVIGCQSAWNPHDLFRELQRLEGKHGRRRDVHWGPRTLDLDLIYHGNRVSRDSILTLPHPGRIYRRFVLDPLCDLAPDEIDPIHRLSMRKLRERLIQPPHVLWLPAAWKGRMEAYSARLAAQLPHVTCALQAGTGPDTGIVLAAQEDWEGTPAVAIPADYDESEMWNWLFAVATAAFSAPVPLASPA